MSVSSVWEIAKYIFGNQFLSNKENFGKQYSLLIISYNSLF
jgi:hypothetical protein